MSQNESYTAINCQNGTDIIIWKGANTAFLVVLFTAIPIMAGLVSLLICKLYGLRRIVAPLNNFNGFGLPLASTTALHTKEKLGSPI